jgi:ELWxxDGT repeat protein
MSTQATLTKPEPTALKVGSLGTLLVAVIIGAASFGTVATRAAVPSDHSNPDWLTDLGGTLFFAADDAVSGRELWRSDGTEAGTHLVKDIVTGAEPGFPSSLTVLDATLYFRANFTDLWRSDGTEQGTTMLMASRPPQGDEGPDWVTGVAGALFFTANDGTAGTELWKTDGTTSGTRLVKDIRAGGAGSYPSRLTGVGDSVYFVADDGTSGRETCERLWMSDGSEAGTQPIEAIGLGGCRDLNWLIDVDGTLFFTVKGRELWMSDGTNVGTKSVGTEGPLKARSPIRELADVDGALFYVAADGKKGEALWVSDGTEAGTRLVKRLKARGARTSARDLTDIGGTLFFVTNHGKKGEELWSSDGTAAGTRLVKDIKSGPGGSRIRDLTDVDGRLFFTATDGKSGAEVWTSDGTAEGTVLLKDVRPGRAGSRESCCIGPEAGLTTVDDAFFFAADDGANGTELWMSDGTEEGTFLVKDIDPPGGPTSRS